MISEEGNDEAGFPGPADIRLARYSYNAKDYL